MNYLHPLLIGFGASVFGTLLPGLLNATVVKISKEEGIKAAYTFMFGTFVIIGLQTYLAVFFAKVIDKSALVTEIIREIGFIVFLILSIYFFTTKPKKKIEVEIVKIRKRKHFINGMLLALINVFPIFYYVFITVTVLNNNLYTLNYLSNILLTIGVLLGVFIAFTFYIKLFKNKSVEDSFVLKNMNKILGCITAFLALINFLKLIL